MSRNSIRTIARGVLPEKFGGGVRPASRNPYPIYDPIYNPTKKFDTLFQTCLIISYLVGQCKTQTADCRLHTGGKMHTEGKMQTADCRLQTRGKMQTEGKMKY